MSGHVAGGHGGSVCSRLPWSRGCQAGTERVRVFRTISGIIKGLQFEYFGNSYNIEPGAEIYNMYISAYMCVSIILLRYN